jgi:hypothetical protein
MITEKGVTMIQRVIIMMIFVISGIPLLAQTLLLQESFERGKSNYDANMFSSGADYFDVFSVTNHPFYAGDQPQNIHEHDYIAIEDSYSHANPLPYDCDYIVMKELPVDNYSHVLVKIAFAEISEDGFEFFNPKGDTYIDIQYAFDQDIAETGDTAVNSGTYTTFGSLRLPVQNAGVTISPTLYLDSNLDGIGDSLGLTNTFQDFSFSTANTGSNISIRIKIYTPTPNEELAIDNVRIYGLSIAEPILTTNSFVEAGVNTATLRGEVTDNGGSEITERGFVYSNSDQTPTFGEDLVTKNICEPSDGLFDSTILGLSPNTYYYFRAYATNMAGTSYGEIISFRTSAPGLWMGSTSSDWNTATNWDDGNVPNSSVDVTIPSGCTNYPNIEEHYFCKNITIETSGQLTISSNFSLNISGNLVLNNGSNVSNNGSIIFIGEASELNDNRTTKTTLGNIQIGTNGI